jgi:hypothetical protein
MQTDYDLENLHKWLNEETNKEIDKQALARLLWYVRCSLSIQGSADFDTDLQADSQLDTQDKLILKALVLGLENTIDLMTDHVLNSEHPEERYIDALLEEEELIQKAIEIQEKRMK